jgi:hypothetical protein
MTYRLPLRSRTNLALRPAEDRTSSIALWLTLALLALRLGLVAMTGADAPAHAPGAPIAWDGDAAAVKRASMDLSRGSEATRIRRALAAAAASGRRR